MIMENWLSSPLPLRRSPVWGRVVETGKLAASVRPSKTGQRRGNDAFRFQRSGWLKIFTHIFEK